MTNQPKLDGILAIHVAAVNSFDVDAIAATFARDALVNDNRREFWGIEAIRAWVAKELVGDKVTMKVTEVIERGNETIVRARYDGNFDKSKLPPDFVLSNYFTIKDGKIATMIVIRNT